MRRASGGALATTGTAQHGGSTPDISVAIPEHPATHRYSNDDLNAQTPGNLTQSSHPDPAPLPTAAVAVGVTVAVAVAVGVTVGVIVNRRRVLVVRQVQAGVAREEAGGLEGEAAHLW